MHGRQYLNALAVIVNYQSPLAVKPLAGGIWGWQLSAAKLAGHYEPKPPDEAMLKKTLASSRAQPISLTHVFIRDTGAQGGR